MLSTSRRGKNGCFASLSSVVIATLLAACGAENTPKPIPNTPINTPVNAPPANTDKVFRLDAEARVTHEATAQRTRLTLAEPLAIDGVAPVTITSNAPRDFPLGETVVTWSAQDQSGKTTQLTQTIVISDTKPPLVDAPPDVTMTVASAGTFSVTLGEPKTFDALDGVIVKNDAPASFAMGETRVTWTATDQAGNAATAVQSVTITLTPRAVDVTPPTLVPPADVNAVSSDGLPVAVTLGTPTATDDSGVPTVTNNAPTQFPVGLTLVSWTAEDAAGNRTVATQRIAVTSATATDTTPPTLTLSKPTTIGPIEATAARTTVDIGTATALDTVDGAVTARNDAPTTGFPLGATTVTWFATDRAGNAATVLQIVTVVDRTPPTISVPANIEQTGNRSLNAVTLGAATATDLVDDSVTVTNNAPAAGFPLTTTVVTWTATDRAGNTARAEQSVKLTAAACSASVPFFSETVWPQVMAADCITCHTTSGVTGAFRLVDTAVSDYLNKNFDTTKSVVVRKDAAGRPLLLSKSGNLASDHGGGARFPVTDPRYLALDELSDRMTVCADDRAPTQQGLVLTSPYQHLRRATLALAGRLPTAAEESTVAATTTPEALTAAMNGILDVVMTEPAFYERVKEIYNDLLLTNAIANDPALLSVDLRNFARENYYDNAQLSAQGYAPADINRLRNFAAQGVGYAPLELIAYVVKNNLPFTEILTADYTMVNPYSATLFSAAPTNTTNFGFVYGDSADSKDPADFRPATITDRAGRVYPHAGVLNTAAFLARYPTTPTNRNRARSRYVFKYFLDTDVEGLADRSQLNFDNLIGDFPTLQDRQCKTCHDVVDPIAGLFKDWSDEGAYVGDRQDWYSELTPPEMLKPGYRMSDLLPSTDSARATAWLALRLVADNKFAESTVKTVASALVGSVAVQDSTSTWLEGLKTNFVVDGFNFKSLIKRIVDSSYFRAVNINATDDPTQYAAFGLGRLLTPEQLDRKISAVTDGYRWRSPGTRTLRQASTYLLLYGGIDSDEITERTTAPTGVMAAIQDRLAYQISCDVTAADFARPAASRVLFPNVSITDTPDVAAPIIRSTIQALHKRLLGEELAVDDPEVTRTFELFVAARSASVGKTLPDMCAAALPAGDPIRLDAQGTVQAWLAVNAYLMSDFRFYFE